MKLVEILARELEVWPVGVKNITQSRIDGELYNAGHSVSDQKALKPRVIIEYFHDQKGYPVVTKADWEAERAKLKAPKANADGWIRHRGGNCPVEAGTLVDVRLRGGGVHAGDDAEPAGFWTWRHSKHSKDAGDIMAYRIHKPAEQPDEYDLTRAPKPAPEIRIIESPDVIWWRNRIRSLDEARAELESTYQRQISEITQERESLVQKLAGEGLALVEVVVQPAEDMSDWLKWRDGDIVEFVCDGKETSCFTHGRHYVVSGINPKSWNPVNVKSDDEGDPNGWKGEYFKFVSRPAS